MDNKPQKVLCEMIAKHGISLAEDRIRCSALLRDYCSAYKAEINILTVSMEEQVPNLLTNWSSSASVDIVIARLVKRLQDDRGLTEEKARWAVESWALALGVIQSATPLSPVHHPPQSLPPPPFRSEQTVLQPQNNAKSQLSTPLTLHKAWGPAHVIMILIAMTLLGSIFLKLVFTSPESSTPPKLMAPETSHVPEIEELKIQNELATLQRRTAEDARRKAELQKAQAEEDARHLQIEVERLKETSRPTPLAPAPIASSTNANVCGLDPNGDNFLSLRTGPKSSYPEIMRMGINTGFAVMEAQGSWLRVQLRNGIAGWVSSKWVCRSANAYVCGLDPNGDNFLSLRTGPKNSYAEIIRMDIDTKLAVMETQGPWLRVQLHDGTVGWVFSRWVCQGTH